MNRTIVWFRRDLRLADHAPLFRAALRGAVIPVFVLDRALLHHPETSVARVAFMLECLRSLDQELQHRGGRLIVRSGDPIEILPQLLRETGADGIYAYLDFERIYGRVRDARLNRSLADQNLKIRWFEPLGAAPDLIPYPEYRDRWYAEMQADQVPPPAQVRVPSEIVSEPLPTLADLGLISDGKLIPPGGTPAARQLLHEFLREKVDRYYWQLSYPSAEATTGLSPYLKFGAISIRECYQAAQQLKSSPDERVQRSRKQLVARLRWGSGFAQRFRYLPQLELRSLYQVFDQEGWEFDEGLYQAWQQGETGFPIVDAAARCLLATGGWKALNFRIRAMHSSFLTNLLGIDWRYGALHYMRHLVDGDCPIDHYQWAMQAGVTHCIDKTWTRIYNPEQSAIDRCDPDGLFIKRWLPELAHLPPAQLGSPPPTKGYPAPILDYKKARRQRVQQLERQRRGFLGQQDVIPYLSSMPESLLPFGSDRVASDTTWALRSEGDLFPSPINLAALDSAQSEVLRSWFVSTIDLRPRATRAPKPKPEPKEVQLSLL